MTTNQQPPLPDARATPEIERAMRQIDRLIRLIGNPIPVTTNRAVPAELHNWELVGPAMLFSGASCLLSIRWLAEAGAPRRVQDAMVLLRRLYEHVVDFAWIAAGDDPSARACQWVADDYQNRLRADTDLQRLGVPGLTAETRANFQAFITQHRVMPDLASRADQADRYWSSRIEGHVTFPPAMGQERASGHSLRTMYVAVYRPGSANAHPTPRSLRDFVWPAEAAGSYTIGFYLDEPIERGAYTMAPLVFAAMLLIAEQALGQPSANDVRAAIVGP